MLSRKISRLPKPAKRRELHPQMNATMEADPIPQTRDHNQDDATGFIRLNGLRPARGIAAKVHGMKK